jgi:hypothetical protein
MAQPLRGGAPFMILPCVASTAYSVAPRGIYYVPCQDAAHPDPNPQVYLRNPATGKDQRLGSLEGFTRDLAVSPDGQTTLQSARHQQSRPDADSEFQVIPMARNLDTAKGNQSTPAGILVAAGINRDGSLLLVGHRDPVVSRSRIGSGARSVDDRQGCQSSVR